MFYFDDGLYSYGFTIRNSTFSGNSAGHDGGGLWFYDDDGEAWVVIENSTFSGNTLRDAVVAANANPGPDVIEFDSGVVGPILLTTGQIDITDDLTIVGPGAGSLTIDAGGLSRIFGINDGADIDADIDVEIIGLTLTGGAANDGVGPSFRATGGAINNDGGENLAIRDSIITGSSANGDGGGVYSGVCSSPTWTEWTATTTWSPTCSRTK